MSLAEAERLIECAHDLVVQETLRNSMATLAAMDGPGGASVQVLVVDDNEGIRDSVSELVGSAGYSVVQACDADSALEILRTVEVGAILLDIRMPGGGGLAVLDALEDPPPVILMSAFALDEEEHARVDPKIFMHLVKPFHPRRLLDALSSAIGPSDKVLHDVGSVAASGAGEPARAEGTSQSGR
jgi:CheY-like chemotaxis protein